MSIMDSWLERVKEKYGSREKGIERLNMVCNMKLRSSEISAYKSGKRGIQECVYYHMMLDVLMTELERAGWTTCSNAMNYEQYITLIDALTPPKRGYKTPPKQRGKK